MDKTWQHFVELDATVFNSQIEGFIELEYTNN